MMADLLEYIPRTKLFIAIDELATPFFRLLSGKRRFCFRIGECIHREELK